MKDSLYENVTFSIEKMLLEVNNHSARETRETYDIMHEISEYIYKTLCIYHKCYGNESNDKSVSLEMCVANFENSRYN